MTIPTIVTGDDNAVLVTLTKDGAAFAIAAGATVKARLVSLNRLVTYTAEIAVSSAAAGSDWANSKVAAVFAPADTAAITHQGRALLEIQVNDGAKLTWFADVLIARGNIA